MKGPREFGPVHFVGIGGIGMSGIAEVMKTIGYRVQGLRHCRELQRGCGCASSASTSNSGIARKMSAMPRWWWSPRRCRPDNPEVQEARRRYLPIVRRAEMLAELMRFKSCVAVGGTHGKTTTTSIVACLLDAGGFDPTVINGGIINAYGTNARLGAGDWMVVESDESDGTFVKLPAEIVVVTNIDPEHLDHYGSFEAAKAAYLAFVENIPFYGFAVMCVDHPEVQALIGKVVDRRIVTYGTSAQADTRLIELDCLNGESRFSIQITSRRSGERRVFSDLRLPMPGEHNALNATAAVAVAAELGIAEDAIRQGLKNFAGVKRRFSRTGSHAGITVIDDYGHHPVEIAAVLGAARRSAEGRIIAVHAAPPLQPAGQLFNEFCTCCNGADAVIVAPVYPAGEAPIDGVTHGALAQGLRDRGHRQVWQIDTPDELPKLVRSLAGPGDVVIFLGAGNITQWAHALPGQLAELDAPAKPGNAHQTEP
jgi:UDP-N-acetylmuramate--alanine ligase